MTYLLVELCFEHIKEKKKVIGSGFLLLEVE